MYQHDNIKQFCKQNPFKLEENELQIIREWTNHCLVKGYLMMHLVNYTVLMSDNDDKQQLYGIKGITSDLADMVPQNHLPIIGDFILLPFKGSNGGSTINAVFSFFL